MHTIFEHIVITISSIWPARWQDFKSVPEALEEIKIAGFSILRYFWHKNQGHGPNKILLIHIYGTLSESLPPSWAININAIKADELSKRFPTSAHLGLIMIPRVVTVDVDEANYALTQAPEWIPCHMPRLLLRPPLWNSTRLVGLGSRTPNAHPLALKVKRTWPTPQMQTIRPMSIPLRISWRMARS